MYRVEMIPKQSTVLDIIGPWTDSGRADNTADGQFVFDDVEDYTTNDGILHISKSNGNQYIYNMADFYRIKVTGSSPLDMDLFDDGD